MQKPDTPHHTILLQTPGQIKALVKQLKPLLDSLHEKVRVQFKQLQQCTTDYRKGFTNTNATSNPLDGDQVLGRKTLETYNAWQTSTRSSSGNPEVDFCLQTAYMHFARIFFVRVCEDYGLISPQFISHNASAHTTQSRTGLYLQIYDAFSQLLERTYRRTSKECNALYGHELYDWYMPDEHITLALYTLLTRYNLQGLSVDMLGRVYNESFIENNERRNKGQFYTPSQVIDYMLDSLDIPTSRDNDYTKQRSFLEKTVGDLSCGSGSFLVAAAARKKAILQRLVVAHEVSPEYAIQILTGTLLGCELNPFACHLTELNLLIQCLPFLVDEQGQLCRNIERFHVYCTDILEPALSEQAGDKMHEHVHTRPSFANDQALADDEQRIMHIKEVKGLPAHLALSDTGQHGIDYLVGNPPYVSAGESSTNLLYRDRVSSSGIYQLLHQRWDLFVPFFERNLQFLRPGTGRLGLIVSNGIETEGYAERLRQALSNQYCLLQIDFFPGQRLFQDAAVENTIVLLENRIPDEQHRVIRRKHLEADCKHFETLLSMLQVHSNGQIFRWRYDPMLDKRTAEGSIPLCSIVYIGTGVEAQSDEDSDPVINGKRQKRFTLNDVFLPPLEGRIRPAGYTDDGVLGDDVDRFYLRRTRYVAYEKYRPQMRGPRHIALFHTAEKLLLGETSGGYYDRNGLFANHSVQVVVSWKALAQAGALSERGIQRVYRKSQQISGITGELASIAALFDLRYLLAIINSRFIREYIISNLHEGTRKSRIYPDIWKRLPVKVTSVERQSQIAILVDAIQAEYKQATAWPAMGNLEIHDRINALLAEIETLVEATYKEPADVKMMEAISMQVNNR